MKNTNQLPKGADSTCDFSPTFCIFLSQTFLVWRDVEWPGGINFLHRMCSKLKKKRYGMDIFFNSLELDVFFVKGFLMQFFHTFLRVQFLMLTKSNFNTTTFQLEHRLALSKVLLSYALLIFETLKKAHELQKVLGKQRCSPFQDAGSSPTRTWHLPFFCFGNQGIKINLYTSHCCWGFTSQCYTLTVPKKYHSPNPWRIVWDVTCGDSIGVPKPWSWVFVFLFSVGMDFFHFFHA